MTPITEAEFTRQVIDFAHLHRWRVAHFRPGRVKRGGVEKYETAVAADGKGWPDLVLVRASRLLCVELKRDRKQKPRPEQLAWLDAFRDCGAEVYLWTPADWPAIEETLA